MATSSSDSQKKGGNLANDPDKAREAGRKGGEHSHSSGSSPGHSGSGGNFADDREKASEAGRKGGQRSHGGGSDR
ncbi:MAG: hypothetical protein JSR66_17125 [Proteobacteria bacterium]|nr:hypothetical protein [Pseudomonadota bacterium]